MEHDRGTEDSPGHNKSVQIELNSKPVDMQGKEATGLQVKEAAIAQGINIQANFVLEQELANGASKVIGDQDVVKLHEHLRFTAIAPDDNS